MASEVDGLFAFDVTLSPDGQYAYVAGQRRCVELVERNASSGRDLRRTLRMGEGVDGLEVPVITPSPDGQHAYVRRNGTSQLVRKKCQLERTLPVALRMASEGRRLVLL